MGAGHFRKIFGPKKFMSTFMSIVSYKIIYVQLSKNPLGGGGIVFVP
jgi:hypothetical protein